MAPIAWFKWPLAGSSGGMLESCAEVPACCLCRELFRLSQETT
jgi:hypothetical protein